MRNIFKYQYSNFQYAWVFMWGIPNQLSKCLTLTLFDLSRSFLLLYLFKENTTFFRDFFDDRAFFFNLKFFKFYPNVKIWKKISKIR